MAISEWFEKVYERINLFASSQYIFLNYIFPGIIVIIAYNLL